MSKSITQPRFEALKREATRAKRAQPGLKRAQILDRLVAAEGFGNWSLLAKAVSFEPVRLDVEPVARAVLALSPPTPKPFEVRISGFIRPFSARSQVFHEHVPTLHPARHYAALRTGPHWQDFTGPTEESLRENMAKLRRGIEFMDATGLRRSYAWKRIFGREYRLGGFDHTTMWMDDARRYIVVTEPYIGAKTHSEVAAWCERKGWQHETMPNGFGIHNPCRASCPSDCASHTQMILMAPAKNGADLPVVLNALRLARSGR